MPKGQRGRVDGAGEASSDQEGSGIVLISNKRKKKAPEQPAATKAVQSQQSKAAPADEVDTRFVIPSDWDVETPNPADNDDEGDVDDGEVDDGEVDDSEVDEEEESAGGGEDESEGEEGEEEEQEEDGDSEDKRILPKASKALTLKRIEKFNAAEDNKGVIYLSCIPIYMRPVKLRYLMSLYGEVGRIFMTPEEETKRMRRKKQGGNKKIKYTEGWVEFTDKRIARRVAANLNNTPVGGKKGSHWYSDLWNMKYLSGFKWHHLTEKLAHQRSVRKFKLRTELDQVKRETNAYLDKVELAKKRRTAQEKKRKREETNGENEHAPTTTTTSTATTAPSAEEQERLDSIKRRFRQRAMYNETATPGAAQPPPTGKKTRQQQQQQ
eukprot:TRINITY_DN3218_c0_g2_i1.p1 TRINITY_DN3218_c0_g2~~TRINITY_DN3218_c0_g2_i1.p1  ORF type:complete len:381 (+),score=111.16 TRINITY_DN3218_c0_g2_i1:3-1145(+)